MKTGTAATRNATSGRPVLTGSARTSRTRRRRGYEWEDAIVKRFNTTKGWNAFRLGSPSTALPDVLAVGAGILIVAEAKSGTSRTLAVPAEQIDRCVRWTETFRAYKRRKVVLAFKFMAKRRTGTSKYERRALREYFKEWKGGDCAQGSVVCTYEGLTYLRNDGSKRTINLKDYSMPFAKKDARLRKTGHEDAGGAPARI